MMNQLYVKAEEQGYYSDDEKGMFLEGLMEKKETKSEFDFIFGDSFDMFGGKECIKNLLQ